MFAEIMDCPCWRLVFMDFVAAFLCILPSFLPSLGASQRECCCSILYAEGCRCVLLYSTDGRDERRGEYRRDGVKWGAGLKSGLGLGAEQKIVKSVLM